MKLPLLTLTLLALTNVTSVKAATLANADSLWQFDGTASGSVTSGQIVDSVGGHIAASGANNISNLTWVNVPTTGPAGGTSTGRGLKFTPYVVTKNDTAAVADYFSASYFISANATVTGSSTLITRLQWDGNLETSDDGVNQWIVNNGLGGWNDTTRQSAGYLFGLTTGGALYYYTAAPGTGQVATGAAHNFTTSSLGGTVAGSSILTLNVGEWYDIAMVVNDLGDADNATGIVTFYLVGQDGVLKSYQRSTNNTWINPNSATNLIVGAESPGTVYTDPLSQVHTGYGNGNNRKTFNGTMDYLAMFDTALTQQEIMAIFAVPEPSRAFLMIVAIGLIGFRRRR